MKEKYFFSHVRKWGKTEQILVRCKWQKRFKFLNEKKHLRSKR